MEVLVVTGNATCATCLFEASRSSILAPRPISSGYIWLTEVSRGLTMNSMKLVIPLHSMYWSIHTKDESKRRTVFAFIFGVN